MAQFDGRDGVAVADVVVYSPAFLAAIYLALKHGFGKSSGWYFVILFCLIRIIGAAMYLATINDPTNTSLYIGSATLQGAGISALILVQVAFLGKCVTLATHQNVHPRGSTAKHHQRKREIAHVTAKRLRVIQILLFVGLILGISGGVTAGTDFSKTGKYDPNNSMQAGLAITLAAFGILFVAAVGVALGLPSLRSHTEYSDELATMRSYESGGSNVPPVYDAAAVDRVNGKVRRSEARRLVISILLSVPFLLVRLIYSCKFTFDKDSNFSTVSGKVAYFVGMSVIMEMIVVIIVEFVGFTLTTRKAEEKAMAAASGKKKQWYEYLPVVGLIFSIVRKAQR